jgi:hypothetical protein
VARRILPLTLNPNLKLKQELVARPCNPVMEFFRTLIVQDPADQGGGLQRQMQQQNAVPDPNAEQGEHEE